MRVGITALFIACGCVPNVQVECPLGEVQWPMTLRAMEGGPPLAGVRGCLLDQPESCGTSDRDGMWAPCVPANADVALTFEKTGFAATIYAIHTLGGPPDRGRWTEIPMFKSSWSMCGIDYPPSMSKGLLWLFSLVNDPDAEYFSPGIAATTARFNPPVDDGPFYSDEVGNCDPNWIGTVAAHPHIFAALFPVDPQTVILTNATHPTCQHLDGGWEVEANAVHVPIRTGFLTIMLTTCY